MDDSSDMLENHKSFILKQIRAQSEQLCKLREELHDAFRSWIPIRTRTRKQLEELATKLHEHHRNVNISTITGASMGTIGGILSVAGLIAAPFTFGAGIVVSIVGAAIGGAGGLVMSGSKVAEIILEKLGLKEVQEAIEDDCKACNKLQGQLDSLENVISSLAELVKQLQGDKVLLRELEGSGFEFLSQRISYEEIGASTEESRIRCQVLQSSHFRSHNICISGRYCRRCSQKCGYCGNARGTRCWFCNQRRSVAAGYHVTCEIIFGAASWIHICSCTRYLADSWRT